MPKRKKAAPQPPLMSRTGVSQDMAAASLGGGATTQQSSWRLPVAHSAPVFDAADEAGFTAYLEEHGYCVIEVLTEAEREAAEDIFWDEALATLGWVRGEPATWHCNQRMCTMALSRSDCGHMRGWDFSRFQLALLRNAAVRRVYAHLNRRFASPRPADYDDQLASFNSINVFRPFGLHEGWRTTAEPWYHVDNDSRPERTRPHGGLVFPGVVNLYEVSAATGGFVAVPKSHAAYQPRGATTSEIGGSGYLDVRAYTNYIDSEPNQRTGNTLHTQPILVCTGGRRGTLTIWDPRLVHCSTSSLLPAEANPRASEPRPLRLAGFVSLCPRAWASAEALSARKRLVEERTCLNTQIPYAVVTQRRFPAVAFDESLWDDPLAVRMLGIDGHAATHAASHAAEHEHTDVGTVSDADGAGGAGAMGVAGAGPRGAGGVVVAEEVEAAAALAHGRFTRAAAFVPAA